MDFQHICVNVAAFNEELSAKEIFLNCIINKNGNSLKKIVRMIQITLVKLREKLSNYFLKKLQKPHQK